MSHSKHVEGISPPDDAWKKMKVAYDACDEAGVEVPREIMRYFNHEPPDDAGVIFDERALEKCGALAPYNEDMRNGFVVDLTKIPSHIRALRFYVSY